MANELLNEQYREQKAAAQRDKRQYAEALKEMEERLQKERDATKKALQERDDAAAGGSTGNDEITATRKILKGFNKALQRSMAAFPGSEPAAPLKREFLPDGLKAIPAEYRVGHR